MNIAVTPSSVAGGWTDERIATLKAMWKTGASASEIACEIGGGLSRNAVIGKVHRLGLSGTSKTYLANRAVTKAASTAVPSDIADRSPRRRGRQQHASSVFPFSIGDQAVAARINARRAEAPAKSTAAQTDAAPVEQRKTLMELGAHDCRWPFGDPGTPGFYFCGAPEADVTNGRPYCWRHAAIAGGGCPRPNAPRFA